MKRVFVSIGLIGVALVYFGGLLRGESPASPQNFQGEEKGVSCRAVKILHRMDRRAPVPLVPMMALHQKENMREHLVAIQKILSALARRDWQGVIRETKGLQMSPQMKRMCEHMGAGAKGFTPLGLEFHRRADLIERAAREKNVAKVLEGLSYTLSACNNCHRSYKQEVVDFSEWQRRTGSSHRPHHMGSSSRPIK